MVDVGPECGWSERVLDSDGDAVWISGEVGAGFIDVEEEEDAFLAAGELGCRHWGVFGGCGSCSRERRKRRKEEGEGAVQLFV